MSTSKRLKIDGARYVLVAHEEFERLLRLAKVAEMPVPPRPDARGYVPAVEYARVSIARDTIRRRAALGLTQRELARLAGMRVETVCRIETGKHTASTASMLKLDRALALKEGARGPGTGRR